jgi:hypothetical protein
MPQSFRAHCLALSHGHPQTLTPVTPNCVVITTKCWKTDGVSDVLRCSKNSYNQLNGDDIDSDRHPPFPFATPPSGAIDSRPLQTDWRSVIICKRLAIGVISALNINRIPKSVKTQKRKQLANSSTLTTNDTGRQMENQDQTFIKWRHFL